MVIQCVRITEESVKHYKVTWDTFESTPLFKKGFKLHFNYNIILVYN